jgi:hypothetical protein
MWNCLFVFFYNFFRFCGVECGVEIKKKPFAAFYPLLHTCEIFTQKSPHKFKVGRWLLRSENVRIETDIVLMPISENYRQLIKF